MYLYTRTDARKKEEKLKQTSNKLFHQFDKKLSLLKGDLGMGFHFSIFGEKKKIGMGRAKRDDSTFVLLGLDCPMRKCLFMFTYCTINNTYCIVCKKITYCKGVFS